MQKAAPRVRLANGATVSDKSRGTYKATGLPLEKCALSHDGEDVWSDGDHILRRV